MLSLFSFLVFSVAADEFDYNTAWQGVLDVVIPEVDAPDPEEVFPEPYLPGTLLGDDEFSLMSLYPENITDKLASYTLTYKINNSILTVQNSSSKTRPFSWSSLGSTSYTAAIQNSVIPVGRVPIIINQSDDLEGFLISEGDTYDVIVDGLIYNLYMEAYSSASDETPTVTEYEPIIREKSYITFAISGVDASGVTRDLSSYVDKNTCGVHKGTSYNVLFTNFRLKQVPYNITSLTFYVYTENLQAGWGVPISALTPPTSNLRYFRSRSGFENGDIRIVPVDTSGEGITNIENNTINIENNTKGIWDSIVGLPGAIMDGIIGLFVPDEGFWDEYYAKYDLLLSENLGFLYESFHLLYELYENVMSSASSMNTVEVPYFSYDFSGTTFEFGGWEVNLVPEGMEILQDICRSISSIIMIIMIVNFGIRMYDKILHL